MTRENKLALVVGFALILMVGILVSDHFSAARDQHAANLLPAVDPLVNHGQQNPQLLRFTPPPDRGAAETDHSQTPEVFLPVGTPGTEPSLRMPDLQEQQRNQRAGIALPREESRNLPYHFHEVANGQSLSWIADHYYDDPTLARELGEFNNLQDNNMLRIGARLRIPPAATLIRGGATSNPAPVAALTNPARMKTPAAARRTPAKQHVKTYTVQSGDVLSIIAQREMGSARHWRKLFENNRSVISDPDHLLVGSVLSIPRNSVQ